MALFSRRASLAEAVEAVQQELSRARPGAPLSADILEISRLLRSVSALGSAAAQELLDGIPDGAGLLDPNGRLVLVNGPLEALVGEGRCLGRTLLEVTRSGELGEAALRALGGVSVRAEFDLPALQKTVDVALAPLSERRALAVLRDLTEEKRSESVRRDFIANASHELRTPVSAISAAVETLMGNPQLLGEGARGFVEIIGRHAERLSRLTRDLLDLSRLEAGDFELRMGPLEVAPLCLASLELARPRAEAKRVTLGFDAPRDLRVLADRRALEQILVNFLDNAVKHTPEGGRVTVLADAASSAVVISVLDTGPGIEPRHQERLFERFYRADSGRSREVGGTGLGLAIVKHLAQGQGGQVGVESGQGGSRFWVKLPAPG